MESEEHKIRQRSPLSEVYGKLRLHYYRSVFERIKSRELSLTTTEAYCVEIIGSLGNPTINQFADFIGISASNATYKVNSLVRKGYLKRVQSRKDRRECHLSVTEKYYRYWNLNEKYLDLVESRIRKALSPEEYGKFNRILEKISGELMPEMAEISDKEDRDEDPGEKAD